MARAVICSNNLLQCEKGIVKIHLNAALCSDYLHLKAYISQ